MRRAIECTKNLWTDLLIYGTSKEAERWQDGRTSYKIVARIKLASLCVFGKPEKLALEKRCHPMIRERASVTMEPRAFGVDAAAACEAHGSDELGGWACRTLAFGGQHTHERGSKKHDHEGATVG